MGDLGGMDLVPEPTIVAAALRACRRIDDYALSTRSVTMASPTSCLHFYSQRFEPFEGCGFSIVGKSEQVLSKEFLSLIFD